MRCAVWRERLPCVTRIWRHYLPVPVTIRESAYSTYMPMNYVHSAQLNVYFKVVLWVPACSTLPSTVIWLSVITCLRVSVDPPNCPLNRPLNRGRNMAATTVGRLELPIITWRGHCRLLVERYAVSPYSREVGLYGGLMAATTFVKWCRGLHLDPDGWAVEPKHDTKQPCISVSSAQTML